MLWHKARKKACSHQQLRTFRKFVSTYLRLQYSFHLRRPEISSPEMYVQTKPETASSSSYSWIVVILPGWKDELI